MKTKTKILIVLSPVIAYMGLYIVLNRICRATSTGVYFLKTDRHVPHLLLKTTDILFEPLRKAHRLNPAENAFIGTVDIISNDYLLIYPSTGDRSGFWCSIPNSLRNDITKINEGDIVEGSFIVRPCKGFTLLCELYSIQKQQVEPGA